MAGFEQINSNSIKLNHKNKDYSYGINLNKIIFLELFINLFN